MKLFSVYYFEPGETSWDSAKEITVLLWAENEELAKTVFNDKYVTNSDATKMVIWSIKDVTHILTAQQEYIVELSGQLEESSGSASDVDIY